MNDKNYYKSDKNNYKYDNDVVVGRNPVVEALKSDRQVETVYIVKTATGNGFGKIVALAKQKGVVIKHVDVKKIDALSAGVNHQGVAAVCAVANYADIEDLFSSAEAKNEDPFFIICDEVEDPHNLGAIMRTAEAAGAHGIIIPKRRSAGLTQIVHKTSAGATNVMPVCRVSNLAQTIKDLKKRGLWIYCADMGGKNYSETDYAGPIALIIGSEGNGVARIIKELSDFVVSIPMCGKINSLNASVSAGIIIYEVLKQKLNRNK